MSEHPTPGVGVAVIDGGRVLVARKGRGPWEGKWAVPGGRVEYGERMDDAAVREVKEETGLDIRLGPVIWTGEVIGPGEPPGFHFTLVDYVGFVLGGSLRAGDDAAEVRWATIEECAGLDLVVTMPALLERLGPYLGS